MWKKRFVFCCDCFSNVAELKKSLNQIINQYMKKTGNLNQDLFFKAMGFPENWKNISRYKL